MKKILFIAKLPPPVTGATIMNNFITESKLIKKSFKTNILSVSFPKNTSDFGSISFKKIVKMFYYFLKLIQILITDRPDLVYFTLSPTGIAFFRDMLYVIILKIFKIKILYHLHGKGINENAKRSRISRVLYNFAFKEEKVICLSEILISDIENVYHDVPYVVNCGIKDVYKNVNINRNNNRKTRILFLSNYVKSKGIFDFLDALGLISNENLDFEARIVGSPVNISIEELELYTADKNINDRIVIVGPKYGDEKYDEFLNSDIFVFPTFYKPETFGLVVLEAMQFGLPVIATYEGSLPLIVDDGITGFLVNQRDITALASKIKTLINNSELRIQMGKNGRIKYLEKFTFEKFEKNILNVFNHVIYKENKIE